MANTAPTIYSVLQIMDGEPTVWNVSFSTVDKALDAIASDLASLCDGESVHLDWNEIDEYRSFAEYDGIRYYITGSYVE